MNILARTAIVPSLTTPDIATAVSRIAEISVVTDPRAIEDEWRRFETSAIGHVFQTFDFVRPWLQKIGADSVH